LKLIDETVVKLAEAFQLVLTLFILGGALQYFDDNDEITGQDDIFTVLQKYKDFCAQNNIQENHELIY